MGPQAATDYTLHSGQIVGKYSPVVCGGIYSLVSLVAEAAQLIQALLGIRPEKSPTDDQMAHRLGWILAWMGVIRLKVGWAVSENLLVNPWRLLVSNAKSDGSLARFQSAVVPFSG